MTEIEWRRRWKPNLLAKSWRPLQIDDSFFLIKSHFSAGSYELLISDLTRVWYETLEGHEVEKRGKKLNPSVEAPVSKILDHLRENLEESSKNTTFTISFIKKLIDESESQKVLLTMKTKLAGLPFMWKFSGQEADSFMLAENMTMPLLVMVGELLRRQQELMKIVTAKDKQIDDYKTQGAKVSRKNLETHIFDDKTFTDNMATSKGFEQQVEVPGLSAFQNQGQELYREIMVKHAWLHRTPAQNEEGDSLPEDGTPDPSVPGQTGASWSNRLPPSLCGGTAGTPTMSPQKSPTKSPTKSPAKAAEADNSPVKDTELLRRQALERRLADEEDKQEQKVMKKKKKMKF